MAVAVSMANNGRDVHPFFMPKASEFPLRQSILMSACLYGAEI